jgi:H+/Cl- antiporter ClcA
MRKVVDGAPPTPLAYVPIRMTPVLLSGTLLTHLFGGSAGSESGAIQIGASVASFFGERLPVLTGGYRLAAAELRTLLVSGISAGFAGVFGTPMAATVLSLEVLSVGELSLTSSFPALVGSVIASEAADATLRGLGAAHLTGYSAAVCFRAYASDPCDMYAGGENSTTVNASVLIQIVFLGMLCGWLGSAFQAAIGAVTIVLRRAAAGVAGGSARASAALVPLLGGGLIIGLRYAVGSTAYLGWGVYTDGSAYAGDSLVSAFAPGGAAALGWAAKLAFTALTLGAGYRSGEITPMFFMGAALGNSVAAWLGASDAQVCVRARGAAPA